VVWKDGMDDTPVCGHGNGVWMALETEGICVLHDSPLSRAFQVYSRADDYDGGYMEKSFEQHDGYTVDE
jgi:hypothetical protein